MRIDTSLCALLVTLCSGLALTPPSFAEDRDEEAFVAAPRAVVVETVGRVIVILNTEGLTSPQRRSQIEEIAFDVFDFATMGKLVLARNWKKFDDAQRKRFISEFKIYLSRNYGSRLDRYRQTDVEITATQLEPRDDVTVKSVVVGGQFDGIEMSYRMRKRKEAWRVIDVVIEGVSLLANFREQFKGIVSNGGPDALLEQMKAKNAASRPDENEPGEAR
jgi:phospholipid transport system substrate-binding protein